MAIGSRATSPLTENTQAPGSVRTRRYGANGVATPFTGLARLCSWGQLSPCRWVRDPGRVTGLSPGIPVARHQSVVGGSSVFTR